MNQKAGAAPHRWRFYRTGGFDQVRIDSAADLEHLHELDQKLWSVLGCPTSGLEFDTRTLQMLDSDGDGQIRSPEIIAATRWITTVLKDAALLFTPGDSVPLDAINTSNPEGAKLASSARQIITYLGLGERKEIGVADMADLTKLYSPEYFNGDGIIPVAVAPNDELRAVIQAIIDAIGSEQDRSGEVGINAEHVAAYFTRVRAYAEWAVRAEKDAATILPFGQGTEVAVGAFMAVRDKIDDFFTRSRLASFDPLAAGKLNPSDETYAALAIEELHASTEGVARLPLARVSPDSQLPLTRGVNPAWEAQLREFTRLVVEPVLGAHEQLSAAEWETLVKRFEAHVAWYGEKPTESLGELDSAALHRIAGDDTEAQLLELIERDANASAAASSVDAVERLVRYRRDLVTLLNNFVSLSDFYGGKKKAIFQAGTLYLDQRSCELCMVVADPDKHATLAPFSGAYLVYCSCARKDEEPLNIVAALTGGDVDELIAPGRNGIFYDRDGNDWNATITKVVENPVSVSQAFWTPYRRIGRMINEQIQKFAAGRDKAIEDKSVAAVANAATTAEAGKPAAAPAAPFDIAKFAGIFAAAGLAVGALGTALAAIVGAFLGLKVWQMPLALLGIALVISGPSMVIAWLKLRQRNLGPLLDANGWAVNTRARINIPFGGSLTGVATLPPGSQRTLKDPYAEKNTPWKTYLLLLAIVAGLGWAWKEGKIQPLIEKLRNPNGEVTAPAEPAPAADAPAAAAAATGAAAGAAAAPADAAAPEGEAQEETQAEEPKAEEPKAEEPKAEAKPAAGKPAAK